MVDKDSPRILVPPPLIFGGLLAIGLYLQSRPAAFGFLVIAGAILAVAGLGLIGLALGLFRKSGTRPEPWQPSSALVVSGIYRRTRNPMYLGMASLCLGLALAFSSVAAVLMTLAAVVIIDRFVVRREEHYLRRRFGDDYDGYCEQVRRWL